MPSAAAIPEAEVIPAQFWNLDPKYFITATNQQCKVSKLVQ